MRKRLISKRENRCGYPVGCPKCTAPLILEEEIDIVDELTKLADQSSSKVELISDDFEEGSILFSAFGGIAAILRYRTGY